jgi:hypothetical protein
MDLNWWPSLMECLQAFLSLQLTSKTLLQGAGSVMAVELE